MVISVHTHVYMRCVGVGGVSCRCVQVEGILGQWSQVLRSISFLLPEDLNSLVHREAQVGWGGEGREPYTFHCLSLCVLCVLCVLCRLSMVRWWPTN